MRRPKHDKRGKAKTKPSLRRAEWSARPGPVPPAEALRMLGQFLTPAEVASIRVIRGASGREGLSVADMARVAGIARVDRALANIRGNPNMRAYPAEDDVIDGGAAVQFLMSGGSDAADRTRLVYFTEVAAQLTEIQADPILMGVAAHQCRIVMAIYALDALDAEIAARKARPGSEADSELATMMLAREVAARGLEFRKQELRDAFMVDSPRWRPPVDVN